MSMGNKEWIRVVIFLQNIIDEWNLNYAIVCWHVKLCLKHLLRYGFFNKS